MDAELTAALAPVLRDLAAHDVHPRIEMESWDGGAPILMLYSSDGFGIGLRDQPGLSPAAKVAELADQVQDWAVEVLWFASRPTNWPRCPHHPTTHPLAAAAHDERAYWKCPADGALISEIGSAGATSAA
ncbi:hypothetical protein GCM10027087_74150 [Paractinoplanes abujensis]|uniref:Uncharacterized protein n=1 Tax=Paractinoplanes abujensis TaxID=882441 RepID=A0A7W7CZF5_9ACTN|nr:hypothetical protein [Actinoplanes abujensis]MBB4697515.1 hypothetical protein [Actinoplanes abujensis]